MTEAAASLLPDGRRLHLQHGPIDLVIEADGADTEVARAYAQAADAFSGVLPELVAELDLLRTSMTDLAREPSGAIARRMVAAVRPFVPTFVTPMAAVAGSVADAILEAMTAGRRLDRAYVNNGGDIALHLAPGARYAVGLISDPGVAVLDGRVTIDARSPIRGVATSGWRGRSQSFGVADSVTVLAASAAEADAAATLLANSVTVDDPAIRRLPARAVRHDSDLGDRPVTVEVGPLHDSSVDAALGAGVAVGGEMHRRGLIAGAALVLQGRYRIVGVPGFALERQVA
jgi:ApbE superfamily uncharacterized protein (UPF0280 family)